MASIWLYCENVKSEYIFFSCPAKLFFSRYRIKIMLRKKNKKIELNSLRGKLIKKICKTKMVLPYTNKKRNKTVVIGKSHEKIFPSKIRLFFISPNWICANYFTYNELYFFFLFLDECITICLYSVCIKSFVFITGLWSDCPWWGSVGGC